MANVYVFSHISRGSNNWKIQCLKEMEDCKAKCDRGKQHLLL